MIARCIRDSGLIRKLTNNMIYKIENNDDDIFVNVMLNGRIERGFYADRFEEVTELRVGDIAQISTNLVSDLDNRDLYGCSVHPIMLNAKGEYGIITKIEINNYIDSPIYKLDILNNHWAWTKYMFELFKKNRIPDVKVVSKEYNIFDVFDV